MTDKEIEERWKDFGDICIDNDDILEEDFIINDSIKWEAGTYRFEVWEWFDENYSLGVVSLCRKWIA